MDSFQVTVKRIKEAVNIRNTAPKVPNIQELKDQETAVFLKQTLKARLTPEELYVTRRRRHYVHDYSQLSLSDYVGADKLKTYLRLMFKGQGSKMCLWGPRGCGKTFWWECLLGEVAKNVREGLVKMRTVIPLQAYSSTSKNELETLLEGAIKLALSGASVLVLMDRFEEMSLDSEKVEILNSKLNWPTPNLHIMATCHKIWTINESLRQLLDPIYVPLPAPSGRVRILVSELQAHGAVLDLRDDEEHFGLLRQGLNSKCFHIRDVAERLPLTPRKINQLVKLAKYSAITANEDEDLPDWSLEILDYLYGDLKSHGYALKIRAGREEEKKFQRLAQRFLLKYNNNYSEISGKIEPYVKMLPPFAVVGQKLKFD